MDNKVLEDIISNKSLFVPYIFTENQFIAIKKRLCFEKLSNSENKQWYSCIKHKLKALERNIVKPVFITADDIKLDKIQKATLLLGKFKEDAFISGSFLFTNNFEDIDVFIISKKRGEEIKGNIHYNYIPRKALKNPIIQSAARSSISNFLIPKSYKIQKMNIFDYINLFQETSLLVIQSKDTKKDIRDLIFHYLTIKNNEIPSSKTLLDKINKVSILSKKEKLEALKDMMVNILNRYEKTYLKKEIIPYNKTLEKDILSFKLNEHLIYYKETLKEALT